MRKRTEGSNPSLSANQFHQFPLPPAPAFGIFAGGEVTERPKVPDSKSGVRKRTAGSNPALSARLEQRSRKAREVAGQCAASVGCRMPFLSRPRSSTLLFVIGMVCVRPSRGEAPAAPETDPPPREHSGVSKQMILSGGVSLQRFRDDGSRKVDADVAISGALGGYVHPKVAVSGKLVVNGDTLHSRWLALTIGPAVQYWTSDNTSVGLAAVAGIMNALDVGTSSGEISIGYANRFAWGFPATFTYTPWVDGTLGLGIEAVPLLVEDRTSLSILAGIVWQPDSTVGWK